MASIGREPVRSRGEFDRASTIADPVDDVETLADGFVAITALPVRLRNPHAARLRR